jgi:tetratricopeptide (TPR) repeat protein
MFINTIVFMDKLKTIISTLSPDEQKAFGLFLQHQKVKKKRKDLELLKLLQEEQNFSPAAMLEALYPESKNQVAYHALRKRLMRQLTHFIMIKQMDDDPSAASSVMGLISLSRFLFAQSANDLAWTYLRKAEKLAVQHEQHDLLNTLYNLQIEYLNRDFPGDLGALLDKQARNKELADEDERANIANSLIAYRLEDFRKNGRELNFDLTIQEVLHHYQLSDVVSKRPRLFYNLMSIARSSVIAKKDFYAFEPFIISQYEHMLQHQGFNQPNHGYHLQMLYMIAHVLYRNKHFLRSLQWLDRLTLEMDRFKRSHYKVFFPRTQMLRAANYTFLNRSEEAVALLEDFLDHGDLKPGDEFNALLNLGFYYFLRKDYQKAIRCGLRLPNSDRELDRKMGREWTMKKIMSETILQFQLGNHDLVEKRILALEKHYCDLLERPAYVKGKTFLQVIKQMNKQAQQNRDVPAYEDIREQFPILPVEQEDLQEMSFFAWLKSQLLGQDYYEVLLEMVGRVD